MREGWTQVAVGDVAEASWGNTSVTKKSYKPSGYLAYSAAGPDGYLDFYEHDGPGVVVSAIGTVGRSWLANGKWTSIKNTIWIKGRPDVALTEFLFLLVSTPDFWPTRGQVQSFLSLGDVRKRKVFLPPLSEQARIVDLVSSVDAYIDGLEKQAEAARTARNAVLHDLLHPQEGAVDGVRVSELLTRSIGGVWGKNAGEDQVDVSVVRSTEFTNEGILHFETGVARAITRNQLESRELRDGDILLEKSGGGPQQPVGRVVFVPNEIPSKFVCSNFVQLLTPKPEKVLPRFLFLVMWKWHLDGRTLEYQAQTTGIRNLRTADYLEQSVSLPSLSEQKRIVGIVQSMDSGVIATERVLGQAKQLRAGLLSDLLSGKHEISESYDKFLGAA